MTKYDLQKAINEFFFDKNAAITLYGTMNCWDVSAITDMNSLFSLQTSMNENISCWNVSNVKDFSYLFYGASTFNQSLCNWFQHIPNNTPNVYSMFVASGCTLKFDINLNTKLHFCSKCLIPVMESGKYSACIVVCSPFFFLTLFDDFYC